MKYGKKTLAIAAAVAALGAGTAGAAITHAQQPSSPSGFSHIVQAMADKFKLDPAEVKQVFDEQHKQEQIDRVAKEKERLDKAVADGKLTQVQEDQLIAKMKLIQADMDALRALRPERPEGDPGQGEVKPPEPTAEFTVAKDKLKADMDGLKAWVTEQKIPANLAATLIPGFGMMDGKGPGSEHGRGPMGEHSKGPRGADSRGENN